MKHCKAVVHCFLQDRPTFLFAADFWLIKAVVLGVGGASVLSTNDRRTILSFDLLGGDTIAGAGMKGCDPSLLELCIWLCCCDLICTIGCTDVMPRFRDERTSGGIFNSLINSQRKCYKVILYSHTYNYSINNDEPKYFGR